MLRRLQALSRQLSDDQQRTAREGLSEPELAVFDLLTKPDPELTHEERGQVKQIARKLMEHITDRLVLDWRRKAETREAARVLVREVLDELPEAYDAEIWQRKTDAVFNHIFASYYDDGGSVYDEGAVVEPAAVSVSLDCWRRGSSGLGGSDGRAEVGERRGCRVCGRGHRLVWAGTSGRF